MPQEMIWALEHLQAQLACEVGQFDSAAALGQKKKKKSQKHINHTPRSRRRAPKKHKRAQANESAR
jgi:hypothetical protein